ncbi:MAG: hypothetical protein ABFR32_11745 [Bacteroidota bacterium]
MNKMKYILVVLLISLLAACKQKELNENVIARVNDLYLYEEDFLITLPENYTKDDSIFFKANFINSWAIEQLLLQKARINVDDTKHEIDRLVSDYRKELLIDKYKEAIIKQNLDTVVTQEDVDQYYEKNKIIYRLNEELVKIKYIQFNKDIKDKKELIKLFKSNENDDLLILDERKLELNSYNLNDSVWVSYTSVIKKLPFLSDNQKLKKINFLQKEDSLEVYLVALKNVLYRNDIAPKSYVESTIKQMILHKRKLEFLKEIDKSLLEDATKNKQFEAY